MKRYLSLIVLLCASAFASDVYYASASAGSNNGTSCANAYAYNDATNGWNTAGKWVGDNTLHICGTFTFAQNVSAITSAGSGTSGHPVTVKFEAGAILQSPAFAQAGAIAISHNYVTVDGGANGLIRNTLNGTTGGGCQAGACSVQQNSNGVFSTGTNTTVQNLTVSTIYVKTEAVNDLAGDNNACIHVGGANSTANLNTVSNCYSGIEGGASGTVYTNNTVSFANHGLKIGISSGTVTGIVMAGNDISNAYNWDSPDNHYHHNGIFVFADPAGTVTGDYYNNFIHGIFSRNDAGGHTTSLSFLEFDVTGSRVFNNVLALDAGDLDGPANGFITLGGATGNPLRGTVSVYNNTIASVNNLGACINGNASTGGFIVKNNIFQKCGYGASIFSGTLVSDYNTYYQTVAGGWSYPGNNLVTFAQWQAAGFDTNGQNGNDPKLTAGYGIGVGSSAIAFGENLTSLSITALNSDKSGNARPAVAKWDDGAFNAGVTPPTCTLTTAPAVIKLGTSSTLTFTPANTPTSCSIDNGVGTVSCSGATPSVSPTTLTTYTATVTNAGGTNTCTATVTIGGVGIGANVKFGANTVTQ